MNKRFSPVTPFWLQGLFEIISELFFEDEVDAFYLLLFAKLLAVTGEHLAAGSTVLSRRVRSALFDRTRGLETSIAF